MLLTTINSQGSSILNSLINSQESKIIIKTLCTDLDINSDVKNVQIVAQKLTKFITDCVDKTLNITRDP